MLGKGIEIIWDMGEDKILGKVSQEVFIEKETFDLRPNFTLCTLQLELPSELYW